MPRSLLSRARSALPSVEARCPDDPGHHPLDALSIGGLELVNLVIETQIIHFDQRLWFGLRLVLAGAGTLASLRRARRSVAPEADDRARPLAFGTEPGAHGRSRGVVPGADPLTLPPGDAR